MHLPCLHLTLFLFFFNDTATTEIYTLSLHDALPISRPGRAATCTTEPEPRSRRYGATAWVSHSAVPALTSIMSRRSSGVAASASPRWYVPMVLTSTSGDPTSTAI